MRTTAPRACLLSLGLALAAALLTAPRAHAANDEWPLLQRAFQDTFEVGGLEDPAQREGLRMRKRSAVEGLRGCHDGRAVGVLLAAHHKQLKFVDALEKQWAKRREPWLKLQPAMESALNAKTKQSKDGQILLTPAEKEWVDEQQRLEALRRDIADEEELAESTRQAMARVCNDVDGDERSRAVDLLVKAGGRGADEEERAFVRVLGLVAGEEAHAALVRWAADLQPFLAATALEALGRQRDPRSVDVLLGRLEDVRWQLRVAALEGLSYFHEERVVEALLARLPQEDGVLVRHVYAALSRILQESLPTTVEAWTSWWKSNREVVLERWSRGDFAGPAKDGLPPVALPTEADSGSTSFYGLRTESKHIIFVIDISGSMGEQGGKNEQGAWRIDVAKRELANAIRSLDAGESDARGASSFNIVAYAAEVRVFKEGKMVPATKANKEKAFKWIEALEAVGATNIYDALEQAFEIIGTRKARKQFDEGADTIFLMTDGQPNRGKVIEPHLIREEVHKLNRERKITIHTIGVGEGHDAAFLRGLASENNGSYLAR